MSVLPNHDHFTLWVLQVQQTVMMLLGKMVNPYTGKAERELEAARWHIDLLSAIEARTKGNLEPDEERLLGQVLTTLRLNYVQEAARPEPAESEGGSSAGAPPEADASGTPPPAAGGEAES